MAVFTDSYKAAFEEIDYKKFSYASTKPDAFAVRN